MNMICLWLNQKFNLAFWICSFFFCENIYWCSYLCGWKAFSALFNFNILIVPYANCACWRTNSWSKSWNDRETEGERESARTPVSIQWIPCDLNSKYKMNGANRIWKTSRLEFVLWFFFFLSFFNFFWVLAAFDENFIGLSDWNAFLSFNLFAWAQRNPITSEFPSIRYISCAHGSAFSVFFSSRIQSLESDI